MPYLGFKSNPGCEVSLPLATFTTRLRGQGGLVRDVNNVCTHLSMCVPTHKHTHRHSSPCLSSLSLQEAFSLLSVTTQSRPLTSEKTLESCTAFLHLYLSISVFAKKKLLILINI